LQSMNSNDPMVTASNVYKLLNENDNARVFKATFNPGDTAKMHHHPDHMVFVLKGGHIKLTSAGKTDELDLSEGAVVFLDEQNHEATNTGNSTAELLVVEFKK
jgi:quercetin dioxygenase-like cupin family protein